MLQFALQLQTQFAFKIGPPELLFIGIGFICIFALIKLIKKYWN